MQYRPLGTTGLDVSLICLGTMTFGEQNTQAEGFAQMDYALDRGVNFFDTAELYSIPPKPETQGATETIIGHWMKERGCRDKVTLASKVTGGTDHMTWFRGGPTRLDRKNIESAIETSLKRLQTDVIDLYYLHWPERQTNFFGQLGYQHNPDHAFTPLAETLEVMTDLVKAGKIKHIGLSNETAWGLMTYMQLAEKNGWVRPSCIQNPYSLLNRSFEVGLAECAIREACPLAAYSPLAFGVLSGKYLDGQMPAGSRLALFGENYTRYSSPAAQQATADYVALAKEHGLSPAQMALAFVNSRDFLCSNIIGATNLDQLKENIDSVEVTLSADVLAGIEEIHSRISNPSP